MTKRLTFKGNYIEPEDFRNLRVFSGMSRLQAADSLSVSIRTIQNWETGGARIPWMAYRMLRILKGYALLGKAWEGWTVRGDKLYAPNGHCYEANSLEQIEQVFGMARLWHLDYKRRNGKHLSLAHPLPGFPLPAVQGIGQHAVPSGRRVVCGVEAIRPVVSSVRTTAPATTRRPL